MDANDRFVNIGGAVMEALISEYGRLGCYANASCVFQSINGPSDGACLQAVLRACIAADPEPKWEEVGFPMVLEYSSCVVLYVDRLFQFCTPATSFVVRLDRVTSIKRL